ncbi:hypothetical protein ACFV5N_06655 [Streptomyces sp. NPDC059853]|uniref:hypothetical protein n=1 Tax=Streptomyces sp. NPDC059853 TaxID=3346973 RepID=UPI003659126E
MLMHLGTNDVWSARGTTPVLDVRTALVRRMRDANPRRRIPVAQPVPMPRPTTPPAASG